MRDVVGLIDDRFGVGCVTIRAAHSKGFFQWRLELTGKTTSISIARSAIHVPGTSRSENNEAWLARVPIHAWMVGRPRSTGPEDVGSRSPIRTLTDVADVLVEDLTGRPPT